MAIKLDYSDAIKKFKKITSPLERYILYQNNNINFDEELITDIKIYQNKIKNFKKNSNCAICIRYNLECIPLNWCLHFVCIDCYPKLYHEPCPFCRL